MIKVIVVHCLLCATFVFATDSVGTASEDLTMLSTPPATDYSCSGLRKGETDRMDDDPDDPLYQVPQANDQNTVTDGQGVQEGGKYFGSCATYKHRESCGYLKQ